jgi:isochorismate hydrolase
MQNQFGVDLVKVAQMAVRFDNKGKLPTEYERLAVDWNPVTMQTPSVTADAVTKEIAAGSVPPTSDVVLKRLGYSSVERARLDQDRKREDGRQVAQALAASLTPGATTAEATDGNAADL